MKQHLHSWGTVAFALLSGLVGISETHAEGSKQLTPNTNPTAALTDPANTRAGYLTHDAVGGTQDVSLGFLKPASWGTTAKPFSEDYRLYVRLKPGETLHYGVHRTTFSAPNYADVVLTLRYGTGAGTIVKQNTLTRDQASTQQALLNTDQAGVIDDAAQARQGPLALSASGYQALTYTNTTGAIRDFFVEFTQEGEYTNTNTQPGFNDLGTKSTTFAGQTRSEFDFWDFTVIGTDNQEKPGRLFSKFWAFTAGTSGGAGYENRLSATFALYPLIPSAQNPGRYYVKQFELAGLRPLVFYFVSNANGSVPYNPANDAATRFSESRKSTVGRSGYAEYPNFVNNPDPEIWPSAPAPNFSRTYQPFCNSITGRGSAAFTTTSEETGAVTILIDLNNNGVKDGNDVLLEQTVTQANVPVTTAWDGRDAVGGTVATGTIIRLTFTSTGAPVNFPIYDAEGNPDGYRVQNIRPSAGGNAFYDRLYWDDRNLTTFPTTPAAPDNSNNRLDGVISSTGTYQGVHRWGNATDEIGNDLTVNTWTYGFISAAAEQTYTFVYDCDFDGDGVADAADLDDDNDGILDVTESDGVNPQTYTLNGTIKTDGTGVPVYLDAAYVSSALGTYRDLNKDGINDIFDIDRDGIPNHFDLDSDGDGLPDAVEANGNVVPTYALATGNIGPNGNRYRVTSQYDVAAARYVGTVTRGNGNAVSATVFASAGISLFGVGRNGVPDAAESPAVVYGGQADAPTLTENASPTSVYTPTDNDADTRVNGSNTARNYNFLDIDSDNDGILDNLEAQSTAAYRAPSGTDTDQDGIDNTYDPDNGGTAISLAVNNHDGDALTDMFDFDSDNDNVNTKPITQQTADWTEGFDANKNGSAMDDLNGKASAFAVANPGKASYYPVATGSLSLYLADADNDDVPNFLDMQSSYYHDDNFNGLVDLFDPAYGGAPSIAPKRTAGQADADFRTNSVLTPLPVELISFEARAAGRDALVSWATASEKNNARFEVERSTDAVNFVLAGTVDGHGTRTGRSNYAFTDKGAGAAAGTAYYRLRQVDYDGKAVLSDVRVVSFTGNSVATAIAVYPSPTASSATLDLRALSSGSYRVELMAADGRLMGRFATAGAQEVELPVADFAKGIYLVRVSGQGQSYLVKLVKN